jgi:hypothetical protein
MPHTLGLLAFVSLLLAAGCSPKPAAETVTPTPSPASTDKDLVSGVGTIAYQDLEGGFYGLVADDGTRYDPLNLDEAFQQDSLRVRFRVRPRPDVMTIRMWGQPVEVLDLARLDQD